MNVRLLNEIENDFELDYNTEEVPDGANGTLIQIVIDLLGRYCVLQRVRILEEVEAELSSLREG